MRPLVRNLMVGALVLWGSGTAAQTAAHCDRDVIVQLSEQVLRDRAEAGRFQVRRVGATAAYLMMHYGGLSDQQMLDLLAQLSSAGDRSDLQDAREMALALAVSRDGVEAGLSLFGGRPAEEAVRAGWHLQRAIVLADAGESYFRLIEAAQTDPTIEIDAAELDLIVQRLVFALLDQSDEVLLQVSEAAEAAGQLGVAANVAAHMSDLGRLNGLMERYAEDPDFGWMMQPEWIETSAAIWPSQPRSLRSDPTPEQVEFYSIGRASSLTGPSTMLGIWVNVSGYSGAAGQVAREVLANIEAGHLRPFVAPEETWVQVYSGLVREVGLDETRQSMTLFSWPPATVRHFSDMADITMDRMVTFHALGPVMAGAAFPPRPSLLGAEAPWEEYRNFVLALAEGRDVLPRNEGERLLGFELLWRAGEYAAAMDWAGRHFEPADRIAAFRDVSRRMDGRCDGVLAFPGQSLLFGGLPLYRFPPEPYNE